MTPNFRSATRARSCGAKLSHSSGRCGGRRRVQSSCLETLGTTVIQFDSTSCTVCYNHDCLWVVSKPRVRPLNKQQRWEGTGRNLEQDQAADGAGGNGETCESAARWSRKIANEDVRKALYGFSACVIRFFAPFVDFEHSEWLSSLISHPSVRIQSKKLMGFIGHAAPSHTTDRITSNYRVYLLISTRKLTNGPRTAQQTSRAAQLLLNTRWE